MISHPREKGTTADVTVYLGGILPGPTSPSLSLIPFPSPFAFILDFLYSFSHFSLFSLLLVQSLSLSLPFLSCIYKTHHPRQLKNIHQDLFCLFYSSPICLCGFSLYLFIFRVACPVIQNQLGKFARFGMKSGRILLCGMWILVGLIISIQSSFLSLPLLL